MTRRWPARLLGGYQTFTGLAHDDPMAVVLSTVLAVVAAIAFAFSTVLQQATARTASLKSTRDSPVRVAPSPRRPGLGESAPSRAKVTVGARVRSWLPVLGLLGELMRHPAWLMGWLLNAIGFSAHVGALHLGAIGVVQAILVAQLPFALLVRAVWRGVRPTARDWFSIACVTAGLVLLVGLRGEEPQHPAVRSHVVVFLCAGVAFVITMLAAARKIHNRPQLRTVLAAAGAGTCFSMTAVLVVVVTGDIAHSGLSGLLDWPTVCVAASSILGTLMVQESFASGSLPTALTTSTITDPVLSGIVGTVLFSAVAPAGLRLYAGLPVAAVLVITGVVLITRSPTLHLEPLHVQPAPQPAAERNAEPVLQGETAA
jgi:hypothetical protein